MAWPILWLVMMFVLSIEWFVQAGHGQAGHPLRNHWHDGCRYAATLLSGITNFAWLIPIMLAGVHDRSARCWRKRVQMTSMPEMVAILNSFGGLAAVLDWLWPAMSTTAPKAHDIVHQVEILLGVFIGSVTFTGSIIACLKLSGSMSGASRIDPAGTTPVESPDPGHHTRAWPSGSYSAIDPSVGRMD